MVDAAFERRRLIKHPKRTRSDMFLQVPKGSYRFLQVHRADEMQQRGKKANMK